MHFYKHSPFSTAIELLGVNVPIYYPLALAMVNIANIKNILPFMAICAVLFYLTILVIKPLYFKVAMSSLEKTAKEVDKPKEFKHSKPFVSLIKKEMLSIFRSPSEIFEYFLFTLLMPFIVFSYDKLSGQARGVSRSYFFSPNNSSERPLEYSSASLLPVPKPSLKI